VGLIFLDLATVHPSSLNFNLHSWDDSIIEGYERFARAIHACGAKAFHQLWHGGAHWPAADGGPPWSSSPLAAPFTGVADRDGSAQVERSYGPSHARHGGPSKGHDGVESTGHGYLPHSSFRR
jgi:2,4-dienoyl-CoA reductase-like NADH-dependent reductase (Old Yellow Enzyme family)